MSKKLVVVLIALYIAFVEFCLYMALSGWIVNEWVSANLIIICTAGWIPLFWWIVDWKRLK